MMKLLTTSTLLLCCCIAVQAQSVSQTSGWAGIFNTVKLGERTSLLNDVQWRSTDDFAHTHSVLIRSGLNYQLTKQLGATIGYAYIPTRRAVGSTSGLLTEHRIWQQAIYNHKLSRASVMHRLRFEQRFLPRTMVAGDDLKTDGYNRAYRARYFIRNILPLQKTTAFKNGTFASLQTEVFLNIGNKSAVNGKLFDQNRLYVAAGYRLSPMLDLEAGYMYQYIQGRTTNVNNNIIQLAGYLRL